MIISDFCNGKTDVYGIIGNPVEHSFSPVLQNTLCKKYSLNSIYVPFKVENENLKNAVDGMFSLGIKGMNVTVPHKKSVMSFVEEVDEIADIIGAVNTLKKTKTGYKGYNTDILGLEKSLKLNKIDIQDKRVMLLGAGGAANSAAVLVCKLGVKELVIVNRTAERAENLKNHVLNYFNSDIKVISFEDLGNIQKPDIIINTTSVGMGADADLSPVKDANYFNGIEAVVDIIYIPWETKLLRDAKNCGCKTVNGFDMLIYQGIASFEIWNNIEISDDDAIEIRDCLGEYFLKGSK